MKWSGESGHACEDQQHKHPYMIDGHLLKLNMRRPIYELNLQQTQGGTIVGSPTAGISGTQFGLTATPAKKYTFDGFSVTGTELTGSAGTFRNSDVTVQASWTYHPTPVKISSDIWGPLYSNGRYDWQWTEGDVSAYYPNLQPNEYIVVKDLNIPGYNWGRATATFRTNPEYTYTSWAGSDAWVCFCPDAERANPPIILSGDSWDTWHIRAGGTMYAYAGSWTIGSTARRYARFTGDLYRLEQITIGV